MKDLAQALKGDREWRPPPDLSLDDNAAAKAAAGPTLETHCKNRERMREVEGMIEGIMSVPYKVAEALAPTIHQTGAVSDSALRMTRGAGQPGSKEQNPLQDIAAMETAAGRSLVFNKLLPSKGLDHICAYVALWRLQWAGLES